MIDLIKRGLEEINKKISSIDIYVVTGVNESQQTYTIKQMNFNRVYTDVEIVGIGLGHGKGILKLLNENDLVLVGFLAGSQTPYILGSIFNTFMSEPDGKYPITKNELFITNRINGASIFIDSNDSILLSNNNGFISLNSSGSITMNSFTFPITDGAAGQVLKTNGAGVLSWQNDNII